MESSIISFSDALNDVSGFRLDAEHYSQQYLHVRDKLLNCGAILLKDCIRHPVITGHTPSMKNEKYYNGQINFIKTDNLRENEITTDFTDKLSMQGNNKIKRSTLKENDIIITIIGASNEIVGRAALVRSVVLPANINQNIALIRTSEKVLPAFIVVYLNSYYGRNCLWYLSRQTEQVNLNCREVEQLLVPNASKPFQALIDKICNKSSILREESNQVYREAEQILLSELGLLDWKPKHQLAFSKNFSDSRSADRIDAEYFQPMYDELLEKVTKYKNGFQALDDIVSIRKCIEPGSEAYEEKGIPFLRVSNLSKFGINNDNQQYISEELYEKLKSYQPKKGEILLSKDATPGITYYLNNVPENMIPSSGILRLKLKDSKGIYPEYLTLVLNSIVVQKQIERDIGGSVINHWLVDQVKRTLIPILPDAVQKEISGKIADSFAKREKSKKLLDIAKRGIEMAIEKSEEEAEKWLSEEVNHAGSSIHLESR